MVLYTSYSPANGKSVHKYARLRWGAMPELRSIEVEAEPSDLAISESLDHLNNESFKIKDWHCANLPVPKGTRINF